MQLFPPVRYPFSLPHPTEACLLFLTGDMLLSLLLRSLPGDLLSLRSLLAGDLLRARLTGDLLRPLLADLLLRLSLLGERLLCLSVERSGDLALRLGGGGRLLLGDLLFLSGDVRLDLLWGDLDRLCRPGDLEFAIGLVPASSTRWDAVGVCQRVHCFENGYTWSYTLWWDQRRYGMVLQYRHGASQHI